MTIKLSNPLSPRAVQPRLWRNLALASATVTLAAMPAMGEQRAKPLEQASRMGATLWLTDGGEAGESGSVDSGDTTVDFLAGLLQVEGHLATGFALLASGDHDNGQAHLGHPAAEVYESLESELTELGQAKFETALTRLSDAAADGADLAALEAIHVGILTAVAQARDAAVASDPKDDFMAISHLIRKAGDEWSEGVVEGGINELHEYQDAWGFVQAARARASALATSPDTTVKAAAEASLAALAELAPALPGVTPEGPIGGESALFASAAAKIELAAFKVK